MPKSTQKITLSQSRDIPFNCLVSNVRRIEAGVSIDCLDIDVKSVVFGGHPPGLIETAIAKAVDERHFGPSSCRKNRATSGRRCSLATPTAATPCSPLHRAQYQRSA